MGQQQARLAGSQSFSTVDWDAKSSKSINSFSASKRLRRKLRKSLRIKNNRSCRDLSATFQYNTADYGGTDLLNLNTASEDELMTLPGITRPTAKNIIAHRLAIGGFSKIEDLALVSGVGAKRMEALRFDISVSNSSNGRFSRATTACPSLSLESLNGTMTRCSGVAPVNVNTATIFELMAVPGLTQELAAGICHIRQKKGRFKSVEALRKVKGMSAGRLAFLRPRLCVENDSAFLAGSVDDNGSADTSDSVTLPGALDTRPSTSNSARASPSISVNSRKCRRTVASAFASKRWDSELDYDIYKLISHLGVRPIAARSEPLSLSHNRVRIALWDLERLSEEKATNLGVQEVICRTLLENDISVLVCHDVTSLSAGECLTAELNQPLLSRVAAWEPQERRWLHIFPSNSCPHPPTSEPSAKLQNGDPIEVEGLLNGHGTQNGTENGELDVPDAAPRTRPKPIESRSGILYSASNHLRHIEYKLVQLQRDLPPALIAHFEVSGSTQFSVVSVDLGGLGSPEALGEALPRLVDQLATELGDSENVIVCGNFLTSPTDEALDELTRLGFHLLHPISSRDHIFHEHLHIWCSSGARALCCLPEAETIRNGLNHPMIPKGLWHWGGAISSHKPAYIELNVPSANGVLLASGQQVLLNGMVSAD